MKYSAIRMLKSELIKNLENRSTPHCPVLNYFLITFFCLYLSKISLLIYELVSRTTSHVRTNFFFIRCLCQLRLFSSLLFSFFLSCTDRCFPVRNLHSENQIGVFGTTFICLSRKTKNWKTSFLCFSILI